jgi:hypothetical protein
MSDVKRRTVLAAPLGRPDSGDDDPGDLVAFVHEGRQSFFPYKARFGEQLEPVGGLVGLLLDGAELAQKLSC